MGPFAEGSFLVISRQSRYIMGGFVELDFKNVCRTGFIMSITPRALSERIIHQMCTDDEPFDSFPIPNPHVEAIALIVVGGRVMNSFVGWFRPWK